MLGQVGPMLSHRAHLGLMLGMLSHVGPILGLYWPRLGLYWPRLGLCWAMLGSSWAHVGPMLGPCWPMLGPMLSHLGSYVGAMFGPSMLKESYDANFSAQGPSWSPKPRKNRCFLTSARWNSLPPKGPKHRKKTMFLNTASKTHRKLQVLQSTRSEPGVVRGWVSGRGAAPITFGYHRRPPARTRAPRILTVPVSSFLELICFGPKWYLKMAT